MWRLISFLFLLFICFSCKTYRMLDGKSRPVYFTPDSSVFNDSSFPEQSVSYHDILNITGNAVRSVNLELNKTSEVFIAYPTYFFIYDEFLVYPGEHILIKKGKLNDFTFLKFKGSKQRNNELSFFRVYDSLQHYPDFGPRDVPVNTILLEEKSFKEKLEKIRTANSRIFDSLVIALGISENFKQVAKIYTNNSYYNLLYGFYFRHRDTLSKYNLYKENCLKVFSSLGDISQKSELLGVETSLNQMANEILPVQIRRILNNEEFVVCFDSTSSFFKGIPRDYLLSQIMYRAYTRRIPVSAEYLNKYDLFCKDQAYKDLVHKLIVQQKKNDQRTAKVSDSGLLTVKGKKVTSLERVISQNRGKLILFDFWATWCAPCIEEFPYMDKLKQQYKNDQISFVAIALDREQQGWQKYLLTNGNDLKNNYLLINPSASTFKKEMQIETIPRYILIGKDGQIIYADAPRPSDPKLKELIDKYL